MINRTMEIYARFIVVLLATCCILSACDSSKKTPLFDDDDVLTIKGTYTDSDGVGLDSNNIHLRNLRRFAYIDQTQAGIDAVIAVFATVFWIAAWPFYWFWTPIKPDDPSKYLKKPNYFFTDVKTNTAGKFEFKIRAGDFYRDQDDGINIDLVNDDQNDAHKFGKYVFVVKTQDTDLGELQLCDLGGVEYTENASNVVLSWTAPSKDVAKYVVNVAMQEDNTLLWAESVDTGTTTLTLPKTVFGNNAVRVAVEAFYTDEDTKKISCLSPAVDFTLTSPVTSKAANKTAQVDGIDFDVTSLTNASVGDNIFLEAFDTKSITLDLGADVAFSSILLHNLKMKTAKTVDIYTKASAATTFTAQGTVDEKRFLNFALGATTTARYIRLDFSSYISDLQEITVY